MSKIHQLAQIHKSKWIKDAKRRRKYKLYYNIKAEVLMMYYDLKDFIRRFV